MYISYSRQRPFHQYFDRLVDEICEEQIPGWKDMKNDPRPQEDWGKSLLPESVWAWDNAANICWLHYSSDRALHLIFGSHDTNDLQLEYCTYDDNLDLEYHTVEEWPLTDEELFNDDFVKSIIKAYCSSMDKDEIVKKITEVFNNKKNKFKPNFEFIKQLKGIK